MGSGRASRDRVADELALPIPLAQLRRFPASGLCAVPRPVRWSFESERIAVVDRHWFELGAAHAAKLVFFRIGLATLLTAHSVKTPRVSVLSSLDSMLLLPGFLPGGKIESRSFAASKLRSCEANAKILPVPTPLFQLVQRVAADAGFDRIGVAPAWDPEMRELEHFATWVDSGYAGEMEYLKRRSESGEYKRSSLEQALPWAKSVIVAAMNYNTAAPKSTEPAEPTKGWISRYALSPRDYHDTVLGGLRRIDSAFTDHILASGAEVTTRCYVDTGPVIERVYAKYAGLGWVGKNTCLIDQQLGSWFFLGVIVTSLEPSAFLADQKLEIAPDRCGSCTRCIDACPTDAIVAPRQLDASRCIAYFTIEKRGNIPEDFRPGIGRHVFGCDICQDVCPWNRKAPVTANPDFQPDPRLVNPDLDELASISPQEFRERFRGSPIARAKHSGFLRNVAVAMGNSGCSEYSNHLRTMMQSEDPTVAEHARWAIGRLEELISDE